MKTVFVTDHDGGSDSKRQMHPSIIHSGSDCAFSFPDLTARDIEIFWGGPSLPLLILLFRLSRRRVCACVLGALPMLLIDELRRFPGFPDSLLSSSSSSSSLLLFSASRSGTGIASMVSRGESDDVSPEIAVDGSWAGISIVPSSSSSG